MANETNDGMTAPLLKLYILETGYLRGTEIPFILPNGDVEIETATWFSGCYLIEHPQGWLLWDTGLSDSLIALPNGDIHGNIQDVVTKTLLASLSELGLTPNDIGYVAFSHVHPDHAGNVTRFPNATLIVNGLELQAALTLPPPKGVIPEDRWVFAQNQITQLWEDYDIFGDGSLVIFQAPGHSVGHQVLMVRLPKAGPMLLGGDLYYSLRDMEAKRVAEWNVDIEQTLRSRERIENVLSEQGARLIMHHDQAQLSALPHAPAYLE